MSFLLDSKARIGSVSLTIRKLERSIAYYQRLGLKVHRREAARAWLGDGVSDLLILHENEDAVPIGRTTGLYHFAILLPTRLDLAKAFKNLMDQQIPIGGYSDHDVSEAIYLADPDGNGIELYRDRPRSEWRFVGDELKMGVEGLDVLGLLGELEGEGWVWDGFPEGTTLGHVHLHVSDLAEATHFYTAVLGFDLVVKYGRSAHFLSVGGYHHHIGMNTWAGEGIPPAPENCIGLRYFSLILPDEATKEALLANLRKHKAPLVETAVFPYVVDPSGNKIKIK